MSTLHIALLAVLTFLSAASLVLTMVYVVPRTVRSRYDHELWKVTAALHRELRDGRVPEGEALALIDAIDQERRSLPMLTGTNVLAVRLAARIVGQAPPSGPAPLDRFHRHHSLGSYSQAAQRLVGRSLLYGSFSGWLFTVYLTAKLWVERRRGPDGPHRSTVLQVRAEGAARRLEAAPGPA